MLPLPDAFTPLVYAAFAAAGLILAHFWVRAMSRTAAAVLVALPLVFTGSALFTARIFGPIDLAYMGQPLYAAGKTIGIRELYSPMGGDVVFQMIPWKKAVRHELKNGRWPVWNRFMLSGDILAASAVPAAYHPIHLASYLLPLGPSLGFIAAAVLLLAALCAFLYLRELDCREPAALIGAAGWMACGFLMQWLQWPHAMTVAPFPLVLLGARRVAREPGWRSTLLLTAAFVLVLLGGHPESVLHTVATGALYGAVEAVRRHRHRLARPVLMAGLAGVLALALCAVDLLPFLDALPQSREQALRRDVFAHLDRSVSVAESLARLRVNAVPFVYGLPWEEDAPASDPFFVPLSSAYVGSCLFPLIVYGLWRHRWRGRWLLLVLGLFGVAAGASTLGVSDLLARLPLFDIAINKRLVFVAGFTLAALAALGADAWYRRRDRRELAVLSLGLALALGLLIASQWQAMLHAGLSRDFLVDQSLRSVVPLLAATGLFAFLRRPRLLALLLLLMAQRFVEAGPIHPVFPARAFFPPLPQLEALHQRPDVFRVVGVGTAALPPNLSALYELEDVRGYQGIYFARSAWAQSLWCRRSPSLFYCPVDDLSRPFLSFLNVRYAIVPTNGEPPPAGWVRRLRGRGASVYENLRVVDRIFVPEQVWLDSPPQTMRRQMERTTDFGRIAWIERPGSAPVGDGPAAEEPRANGPGKVAFSRRPYGWVIDAEMDGPGWVVASETAWRGWRAHAGSEELPIAFANRGFIAFHLAAGRHRIELVFRPASFVWGRAITFWTGGLLLLSVAVARRPGVAARPLGPAPT